MVSLLLIIPWIIFGFKNPNLNLFGLNQTSSFPPCKLRTMLRSCIQCWRSPNTWGISLKTCTPWRCPQAARSSASTWARLPSGGSERAFSRVRGNRGCSIDKIWSGIDHIIARLDLHHVITPILSHRRCRSQGMSTIQDYSIQGALSAPCKT